MEKMRDLLPPTLSREPEDADEQLQTTRRVDEALRPDRPESPSRTEDNETIEIDMSMTSSPDEQLRSMDFQTMSKSETARRSGNRQDATSGAAKALRYAPESRRGRVSFSEPSGR